MLVIKNFLILAIIFHNIIKDGLQVNIALPYGTTKVNLHLPQYDVNVNFMEPLSTPPLEDVQDKVKRSLEKPSFGLSLREMLNQGESVSIIINDITRTTHSSVILPPVIETCLQAGIKASNIRIIVGGGAHRLHSKEELRKLAGENIFSSIQVEDHNCQDPGRLLEMGLTSRGNRVYLNKTAVESDRKILIGSINYHYCAGYSGGRKNIVPGIAGFSTIEFNHKLMFSAGSEIGNLDGNPMHLDMLEGALMLEPDFILNEITDGEGRIIDLVSGDCVKAHAEGCRIVDSLFSVGLEEKSDLVIASCGGYPKDINLYQSHKALETSFTACKDGGSIILLAKCDDGIGSEKLKEAAQKKQSFRELEEKARQNFQLGIHKAYRISRLTRQKKTYLISSLDPSIPDNLGFRAGLSLGEAIGECFDTMNIKEVTIIPYASTTLPRLK